MTGAKKVQITLPGFSTNSLLGILIRIKNSFLNSEVLEDLGGFETFKAHPGDCFFGGPVNIELIYCKDLSNYQYCLEVYLRCLIL